MNVTQVDCNMSMQHLNATGQVLDSNSQTVAQPNALQREHGQLPLWLTANGAVPQRRSLDPGTSKTELTNAV